MDSVMLALEPGALLSPTFSTTAWSVQGLVPFPDPGDSVPRDSTHCHHLGLCVGDRYHDGLVDTHLLGKTHVQRIPCKLTPKSNQASKLGVEETSVKSGKGLSIRQLQDPGPFKGGDTV
jgi:hypothetical protein